MLTTFALSLMYHLGAALCLGLCCGMGAMFGLRADRGHAADWLLAWFARGALGLAVVSMLVVVLGLAHVLYAGILWPLVFILAAVGFHRARGEERPRIRFIRHSTSLLLAMVGCGILSGLCAANVIVGALAPDGGQDSMWYHLSVPAQWVLRGDVAMFSNVTPSTYSLAADAHYAALLMVGDEVLCTSFYAQVCLIVVAWFAAVAWRIGGGKCALLVVALVPGVYLPMFARAPVSTMNDLICGWWMAAACWLLIRGPLAGRSIGRSEWVAVGAMLGTAVAGKLFVLLFALPLAAFFAFTELRGRGRMIMVDVLCCAATGTLAMAPWIVRSIVNGVPQAGNPLVFIAPSLFPINPEYAPAIAAYAVNPRLYGNVGEALTKGLPMKLSMTIGELDVLAFVGMASALIALGWRKRGITAASAATLAGAVLFVPLRGNNELVRYLAIGHTLAAPAIAQCLGFVARRLGGWSFAATTLLVAFAAFASNASRQMRWSEFATVNWHYRPILTRDDRDAWMSGSEIGRYHAALEAAKKEIPQDGTVLLLHCPAPYYLKRRAYWTDYFGGGGVLDHWWRDAQTDEQRAAILRGRKIDFVLSLASGKSEDREIDQLQQAGFLDEVVVEGETRFRLWRIRP
ncbi:hypothetical protein IT570_10635 [Candidatus Sumerlaeota bacterium]|nr:hypothetical protein [Candidatus Sumerlaeota bacterium]